MCSGYYGNGYTDEVVRAELAWLGVESNEFGTDEFMKWCEVVGTEPYFALNMGTGTYAPSLKIHPQSTDLDIGTLDEGKPEPNQCRNISLY